MPVYTEEFWRCLNPECNNPYFYIENKYIIAKDKDLNGDFNDVFPRILKKETILICTKCGAEYTRKELIENDKNRTK
jgi:hypothetical protein